MKAPALYVYLQFKIAEHSDNKEINKDKVLNLFSHYNLPKRLRILVIKEMGEFGLLREKFDKIKIINCKISNEMEFRSRMTRRKIFETKILNTSSSA